MANFEEDALIRSLDSEILKMAKKWSRDDPDSMDDLAQEARLGILTAYRKKPHSPRNYLFQEAKDRIIDYRKRGKSIDGKLNKGYKRQIIWNVISLDIYKDNCPGESLCFYSDHSKVAQTAISNLTYNSIRSKLTEIEDRYLSLKLEGYSGGSARLALGMSRQQEAVVRDSIREKSADILEVKYVRKASHANLG